MAAVEDRASKCFQSEDRHRKCESKERKHQCRLPVARIEHSVVSEHVLSPHKKNNPKNFLGLLWLCLFFFPAPPVLAGEV